jgi:hypothetical protein
LLICLFFRHVQGGSDAADDASLADYLFDSEDTKPPITSEATASETPTVPDGHDVGLKRAEVESGEEALVEPHEAVMIHKTATHDPLADQARVDVNKRLHQQCKDIKVGRQRGAGEGRRRKGLSAYLSRGLVFRSQA